MKIAIIGAGAAGYFAALTAKNSFPECEVQVFEKTGKYSPK
jgi:protoporphyrinogen oxidase